jgi:hypothetical protein
MIDSCWQLLFILDGISKSLKFCYMHSIAIETRLHALSKSSLVGLDTSLLQRRFMHFDWRSAVKRSFNNSDVL